MVRVLLYDIGVLVVDFIEVIRFNAFILLLFDV
jgi:hypothetical protein